MKNFFDTIGNGTRDLLACSAVPQQIAPPIAPNMTAAHVKLQGNILLEYVQMLEYTALNVS
jgi:hypothetical protein